MKHYVGIDLGTTNSAITTFDGEDVRLYKSPETNDVTPSAIFIDRRGTRFYGARAYNSAARSPDNAAILFKRFMGTSTPIKLAAVDLVMTPEDNLPRRNFRYKPNHQLPSRHRQARPSQARVWRQTPPSPTPTKIQIHHTLLSISYPDSR